LPSGGSIVIDRTEALTAIDINSARSTKGEDIEETALNTNVEAADEIGRQLRIRDLGGLVVVDFIDMGPQRNQREVENRLRDAVKHDRARIQIGRISRFGLLELSRQRLRPSLEESTQSVCPRCNGAGNIRSVESLALAVLRLVGEEARKERTAKVIAQLPLDVANYVLNEKRDWVQSVQEANNVQIVLIGNPDLETPNYSLRRVRDDETTLPENAGTSYKLVTPKPDPSVAFEEVKKPQKAEEAAVSNLLPSTPVPTPPPEPPASAPEARPAAAGPRGSLLSRLFGWLSAPPATQETAPPAARPEPAQRRGSHREHPRGRERERERDQRSQHADHRRDRGGRGRNRGQRMHSDGGPRPREAGDGGQRPPRTEPLESRPREQGQPPQQGQGQGHRQGQPRQDQPPGQQAQGGGRGRRGRRRGGAHRDDRQREQRGNGGQPPRAEPSEAGDFSGGNVGHANDAPPERAREFAADDRGDIGFDRGPAERAPDAPPPAFEPVEPAESRHEPVDSHAHAEPRERTEPQQRHDVRESAPEPSYRPEPQRDAAASESSDRPEPEPIRPEPTSAPHDDEQRTPPDRPAG